MKRFLINISSLFLIFLAVMCILVFIVPRNRNSAYECYNAKIQMVRDTPSPRIIFVSGSSLFYSLDSKRVADSLHVNVVNYALHAGIGMRYWLDEITPLVHEGDLVVLAPEYAEFYGTLMNGNPDTWGNLMLHTQFHGIEHANKEQIINGLTGLPMGIISNLAGLTENKKGEQMNKYGDHESHWKKTTRVNIPPASPAPPTAIFSPEFMDYFAQKVNQMKKQGAKVMIVPAVIRQSAYQQIEWQAKAIEKELISRGLKYNSSPAIHALPDSMAYDSDYHMAYSGVCANTSILIDEIKASGLCPK